MQVREGGREGAYWLLIAALIVAKAVLVSDLSVQITYAPHDDSMYVIRANYLLRGEAFGPYDSHTLSKLPGMSVWLAAVRLLGIPHLLAINALYVGAGLYFLNAVRAAGAPRPLLLAIFAVYLFNPITLGLEWHRVLREPLGTGLFVILLAAMLHLLLAVSGRARVSPHLAVLSGTFAFALILREEDRLLWAALALFAVVLLRAVRLRSAAGRVRSAWFVALAVVVPASAAILVNQSARAYVEAHYGLPILHDMSEGEFPRLLAAIRSVASGTDNRLVMAPQDTLQRLRTLIPQFAPVVDRLPPPGPDTFSCQLQGVCSEWSNGWMPFWIKDAADSAELTPSLEKGQAYFADVRTRIDRACESGSLKCAQKGDGLLPPFELRWSRAFLSAFFTLVAMASSPNPNTVAEPPLTYNVSLTLGRVFQAITMTNQFDGAAQTSVINSPERALYVSPLSSWRVPLSQWLRFFGAVLIVGGLVALVIRWTWYPSVPETELLWIVTLFLGFSALRLAALSYVAVFLGPFDSRIVFVTYTGALLCSFLAIAEVFRAARVHTPPSP